MTRPEGDDEPDHRFSLANERTFLAWVRTSLALLAAGVGVIGVASHFSTRTGRDILGGTLVALGLASAATSYWRWHHTQHAIRTGAPLPAAHHLAWIAAGLTAVAAAALILVITAAV